MIASGRSGRCDAPFGATGRHDATEAGEAQPSHMLVVRVVPHVADEQHHWLVAQVLPPVRGALGLGPDLAGLVMDRSRAVAGVFDDLALGDVDQCRSVVMAVPWHDAA